jgi:pyridoxamine 5'-phosphate oxidase family protein
VVDDVPPPWRPRLIEIRGAANRLSSGGTGLGWGFSNEIIRITPTRIVSWGIDDTGRPDLPVPGRDVADATKALP